MKNTRIKLFIIAAILGGFMFMSGFSSENSLNANTMNKSTLAQAIETGKKEIQLKGLKIDEMNVKADEENSAWEKFSTQQPSIYQSPFVKRMELEKKKYWAIYFGPKKEMLGGDAWVFVDKNSGETIGVVLGR